MKQVIGLSGKHPVFASRTMYVDDPDGNEVEFICHVLADEHILDAVK